MESEDNIIQEKDPEADFGMGELVVKAGTLNKLVENLTAEEKHGMAVKYSFVITNRPTIHEDISYDLSILCKSIQIVGKVNTTLQCAFEFQGRHRR